MTIYRHINTFPVKQSPASALPSHITQLNIYQIYIPYLIICHQFYTGEVPRWLSGSLLRNGSGKYTVGSDEYQHLFDGLAVIHQYKIEKGKVLYKNKLLETETKDKCLGSKRIIVSEFGTVAYPDPCKSLFNR